MNRSQLINIAVIVSTAMLGSVALTTWQPSSGVQALSDAGVYPTNSVACDVKFSSYCIDIISDAGIIVDRYERIAFPVMFQSDGGYADAILPPSIPVSPDGGQRCVQVMKWGSCVMLPCSANQAVCDLWGSSMPFVKQTRPCVRQNVDAGFSCPRRSLDGGSYDFGDMNVFQRQDAVDSSLCQSVQCAVFAGDNPSTDL